MNGKVTYRQQYTRCGKERCRKCKEGSGHGPYWYAFWSENGRTVSKYIGARLPDDIAAAIQAQRESRRGGKKIAPQGEQRGISPGDMHALPAIPFLSDSQTLRIYTLGQLRIERLQNGEWSPIDNRFARRRRARALLGCLLSSPGRKAGREQIMEALWPDLDSDTATNRLNGAVHELRQLLEPEIDRPAASRMLRLERDILILADRAGIWVDAEAFESLINEAHQPETRELSLIDAGRLAHLLEEADRLYAGDYLLEELYAEWAAPRRDALKRSWISMQLKLSELWEALEKPINAMEPLNRLLSSDPINETAAQRLMRLLTQLDRRGEALNVYRRLTNRLRQVYESEPMPETRALYDKLRQGQSIEDPRATITIKKDARSQDAAARTDREDAGSGKNERPLHAGHTARSLADLLTAAINQPGRANQSPLIGREQETAALRQVLAAFETRADRPLSGSTRKTTPSPALHFALLTGDAGIGKTRLAEELSHEAASRGWLIAWAHAYEQEGAIPYRPWIEVLRAVMPYLSVSGIVPSLDARAADEASATSNVPTALERLNTLLPELRRFLAQDTREYPPLPLEQERLHLWEAMLELLSALSEVVPVLLVLDDLHWTDDSSREMLAYLVRHLRDQRILCVGTCRDVELAPNDGLRTLIADLRREQAILTLAIQPLSPSQIGSLVAHLPQDIVQDIQTRAGGNPFFAEEMARVSESTAHFAGVPGERGSAVPPFQAEQPAALSDGNLPEGIAAVLDRRLGRLSEDCRALLGKAAVLGGAFALSQLLSMAPEQGEDALLDLLDEALRAGLLTEEGAGTHITYSFWHPLIVSHLYERLSAARRAQLHRRAAAALIQASKGREHETAAVITRHLSKGGGDPALVALYAELAADRAYSLAAYTEARQYYLQAIHFMTGTPPAGIQAAQARPPTENWHAEVDLLHVARLQELVGECASVLGDYEEARSYFEQALELHRLHARRLASAIDPPREAQAQAMLWREIGRTWSWNGNYEQAHQCYQRGKETLHEAGITSGAAWACIHLEYGRVRVLEGNYEEARRCVSEALILLEQALAARIPEESAIQSAADNGHPSHHIQQTETERAIAGDPLEVGRALELLGLLAAHTGQYTEALQYLHKALAIFEQHDLVIAMVKVCGNIGAVHLTRAENALAQPYMRRALELAERMGNAPMIAVVTGNLGEQATRSGNLIEAEEWFRRSLAVAGRINEPEHVSWCSVALAGTLQDLGQFAEAAACIRRALLISRSMKSARSTGGALVALGDLRVAQAIISCKLEGRDPERRSPAIPPRCHQLLLRARSTVRRALSLEGLDVETEIEGRLILASVYLLLDDLPQAEQLARETLKDAAACELTRLHARALRLQGRILSAQHRYEQADTFFKESLAVFRQYDLRLDYARALHGYAITLIDRDAPGTAAFQRGLDALREAGELFSACRASIDLQWIEQELRDLHAEAIGA